MAELVIPLEGCVLAKDCVWAELGQVCRMGRKKVLVRSPVGDGQVDVLLSRDWVNELVDRMKVAGIRDLVGRRVLPVHDCVKVRGRFFQRCLLSGKGKSVKHDRDGYVHIRLVGDLAGRLLGRIDEALLRVMVEFGDIVGLLDEVLDVAAKDCGLGSMNIEINNCVKSVGFIKDTVKTRLVKVLLFKLIKYNRGSDGIERFLVRAVDGSEDELDLWIIRVLRDLDRHTRASMAKAGKAGIAWVYKNEFMVRLKSMIYYKG
jgi:hypothetical protein